MTSKLKIFGVLLLAITVFCVQRVSAQSDPVLEISVDQDKPMSVYIDPAVSRKASLKRSLNFSKKKTQEPVPFAISAFATMSFSKDGNSVLVNHGAANDQSSLFLDAETDLAALWSQPSPGTISPTGENVLLKKQRELDLADRKGNTTKLLQVKRGEVGPASFGPSGNLYLLHEGDSRTEGKVRFIQDLAIQQPIKLPPVQMVVSSDETKLATRYMPFDGPVFGKVVLIDVATGEIISEKRFEGHNPLRAEIAPDGSECIVNTTKTNYLLDLPILKTRKELPGNGPAGFSKDGTEVWKVKGEKLLHYQIDSWNEPKASADLGPIGPGLPSSLWMYGQNIQARQQNLINLTIDTANELMYRTEGSIICDLNSGMNVGFTGQNAKLVDGANKLVYRQEGYLRSDKIEVYNFEGELVRSFKMGNDPLMAEIVALSPDGSTFIYRQGDGKRVADTKRYLSTYNIYDSKTGKKIRALGRYDMSLHPIFSPDGSKLFFRQQADQVVREPNENVPLLIVDFASGRVLHQIEFSPWFNSHAQFSPDSKQLLLCGSINIRLWDEYGHWGKAGQTEPPSAAWKEYDQLSSDWVAIRVTDLKNSTPPVEIRGIPAKAAILSECKLSTNGDRLLVTNNPVGSSRYVSLWDAISGTKTFKIDGRLVAANDDLTLALIGKVNEEVTRYRVALWDLTKPREIAEVSPFPEPAESARFTGSKSVVPVDWEKQQFVAAGAKGITSFFEIKPDGSLKVFVERRFDDSLGAMVIRPAHGKRQAQLVGHCQDGSIRFYDLPTLQELNRMYFFEDGAWIAIDVDGTFTGSKNVGRRLSWRKDGTPAVSGAAAITKFQRKTFALE